MKQRLLRVGIGFGISVFVVFLAQMVFIPVVQYGFTWLSDDSDEVEEDAFALGQYYFNHADDSGGTYDLKKARMYYEQVILEDPTGDPQVWHQLGRIDFLEGDSRAALYKFDKQIEYFGDIVPNVYYMIGLTYGYEARESGDVKDWEKGEEAFKTFLSFDPKSPWARTDLSWIYFAQGKFREMFPVLQYGLEHNPDHPWLLNMYGLALRNVGQEEEAQEYFVRAQTEVQKLTTEDWGSAYPGNSPEHWADGLAEFRTIIDYNTGLIE